MNKLPNSYPIYEIGYGYEIPIEQVYVHIFDVLPSKANNSRKKYSINLLNHLIELGFNHECETIVVGRRDDIPAKTIILLNKELKVLIILKDNKDKINGVLFDMTVIYDVGVTSFDSLYEKFNFKEFEVVVKKSGINLVKSEMGHLDTEEYEMMVPDMNLELNYGKDFIKIHEHIIKRLNNPNDKGIILFHGDPGTGKTSYIKYLTRLIEDKQILFIPPAMAESLSEPSIIPFLMEHKNSILIVEDAERVIADRENNGSSVGVSNILNLTDGILGDCLNIQVIATFNMKREKIDQALLRKGRLIAEHKFTKLSVEDTNNLLKHLGNEKRVDKGMCLADIYNIDEEIYKTENNKTQIGFNN
jgi:PII-like signaling protein